MTFRQSMLEERPLKQLRKLSLIFEVISEILPPWKYISSRLRFWEIYTEDFEKSLIAKHAMRLPSLAMADLINSWLRFKLFKGFFFS